MTDLIDLVRSVCECPGAQIDPGLPLRNIEGWDSMRAVNFIMELESKYGVDLSDVTITGALSLEQVDKLLREKGVPSK